MTRPSDIDIFIDYHANYAHIERAEAVKQMSDDRGVAASTIRTSLVRASDDKLARLRLIEHMSKHAPTITPARHEINKIIAESTAIHDNYRKKLRLNSLARAVFMSDIHFPMQDNAALELAYKIIDDFDPHIVSAGNDDLDFANYSHWQERRSLSQQLITEDISHILAIASQHYQLLHDIAPQAIQPYVGANHNARIAVYPETTDNDTRQQTVMQQLRNAGVLFLNDMSYENVYQVNDRLVWFHGQSASSNSKTTFKNNYQRAKRVMRENKISPYEFDIVYGHTHRLERMMKYDKIISVRGWNSGCLCDLKAPYLKNHDWIQGIVLSTFDPSGNYHDTQAIEFVEDFSQHKLRARVNGKSYSVGMR